MALILRTLWDGLNHLRKDNGDPRSRDFLFAQSPIPMLLIVSFYTYFSLNLGPKLMKNRKPFDLKNVILLYNAAQVLFSMYLVYIGSLAYINNYNWLCQPLDESTDPVALFIVKGIWLYHIAKITELLDTVFFVLRKKDSHISFLHLYHHASMPFFTWFAVKYFPSGHGVLMGWLNSFVHVFMYFYYLLAGLGPQYQKYLWWKRHITILQLLQFSIIFVHNLIPLFTSCGYPKAMNMTLSLSSLLFMYMFGNFYVKTYMRNKNETDTRKLGKELNGHDFSNGNSISKTSNGHSNGKHE